MSSIFFSKKEAEKFEVSLKSQGYETQIWMDTDGFKQTIYIVKWY